MIKSAVLKRVGDDPAQFRKDVEAVNTLNDSLPLHPDDAYARSPEGQAHQQLASLFQDFAGAVSEFRIEEAEEILKKAKEVAQTIISRILG